MPTRTSKHTDFSTLCGGSYRYGYNGMEKDDEAFGEGNSYTTEFRQYDPRLGRWMSLDPLQDRFPSISPYVAFNNNPILLMDANGKSPHLGGLFLIGAVTDVLMQVSIQYATNGGNMLKAWSNVDVFDAVMTGFETAIGGMAGLEHGLARSFTKISGKLAAAQLLKGAIDFKFESKTTDKGRFDFSVEVVGTTKSGKDFLIDISAEKVGEVMETMASNMFKQYSKQAASEIKEAKRMNITSKEDMKRYELINEVVQSKQFQSGFQAIAKTLGSIQEDISGKGLKYAVDNFFGRLGSDNIKPIEKTPANVADKTSVKNPFKFKLKKQHYKF